MDGLQRGTRKVGSLSRFMSDKRHSTIDPAELEKLKEFKDRIGDHKHELKALKRLYEDNVNCRLNALEKVHDFLLDFQQATNSFGQYFTMDSVLNAWVAYFTDLIRFVDRIVDSSTVKEDLNASFEPSILVTVLGKTLIQLLDTRYDMVLLVHDFLKWAVHCGEKEFDVHIFRKARTAAKLIDETVEKESNRLVNLGLDTMSNVLAVDMFVSLIQHGKEIDIEKLPDLQRLQGTLAMVMAMNSITIQSSKAPIKFDEFPNVKCSKI